VHAVASSAKNVEHAVGIKGGRR